MSRVILETKDDGDLIEVRVSDGEDGLSSLTMFAKDAPPRAVIREIRGALGALYDRRDRRPRCGLRVRVPGYGERTVCRLQWGDQGDRSGPPKVWVNVDGAEHAVVWEHCRYLDESS